MRLIKFYKHYIMKRFFVFLTVALAIVASCGKKVDVQAHRGGMGLMPENTLAAMLNSVDLGVNTLELDLVLSGLVGAQ